MLHLIIQTQANMMKFKWVIAYFPTHFILKVQIVLEEPTQFHRLPC